MKKLSSVLLLFCGSLMSLFGASELSQYGITWKFDRDYPVGKFVNGDYYVIGNEVKVISITNNLNDKSFPVVKGKNGSMVNPEHTRLQGFDSQINKGRMYDEKLNAALPGGKELSAGNPLILRPGDSLVSSVSWLWRSGNDREPGAPRFSPRDGCTRSTLRSAAVLTCLDKAPPEGTFRPGYCGRDKKLYNFKDLKLDRLAKVDPAANVPAVDTLTQETVRPWLDHISNWDGAYIHPTENMPNYGRDMCHIWLNAMLLLNCDPEKLPGKPDIKPLLVNIIQHGIDLASMAKCGTDWPANGGHCAGRKPVILFAGMLLDDPEMKAVGTWKNRFQDNEQTFFVTEKEIDMTASKNWKPDRRAARHPYTREMLGMPEWGIVHAAKPSADNAAWNATYRGINNGYIPGFALVSLLMNSRKEFNHEPYFDYADRVMADESVTARDGTNRLPGFGMAMWKKYRGNYPSNYKPEKYGKFYLSVDPWKKGK